MSIDIPATVIPGGHGSGQAAEVANRPESASFTLRPSRTVCPFCEHHAVDLPLHIGTHHRERVEAAAAYRAALDAGASLEAARTKYNAIVRAAIEGGPGRYARVREAAS